jgi:uncharacterized protein (TIGR00288 family)
MFSTTNIPNIAVLIDAENAQYCTIKNVLDEVATYGNISVKRAYGDFSNSRLSNWKNQLNACAIQPVHGFAFIKEKNATDMLMVIDAMDLLHSTNIDIFCIVAGDSDYISLVQRVRKAGKYTIGASNGNTSRFFVEACDKFIDTTVFKPKTVIEPTATDNIADAITPTVNITDVPALDIIDQTFTQFHTHKGDRVLLSQLTEQIRRINRSFAVKNYGYTTLSQVFKDGFFQTHYKLYLHTDRTTYSVERVSV